MESSVKKILASTIVVSFLVSGFAGFVFGIAGSAVAGKYFPQINKAAGIISDIGKTDKNVPANSPATANLASSTSVLTGSDQALVIDAIKKADPAVVSIVITKDLPKVTRNNPFGNDSFFQQFFGQDYIMPQDNSSGTQKQEVGRGSGFIVSADGYIVTNKHVASDKNSEYTVLMNDGKEYPAKFLAADPVNDLAIIKIEQNNLPTVVLGDSNDLDVGQTAIAIGNSLGEFRNTASLGIISGLGRSITASGGGADAEQLSNIIQTDAAINPGNSGGPLLDLAGNVIGVNVAMAQGAQSIGFAIPINDAKKAINDVKTIGRIVSPYIGVRYMLINDDIKIKNNLSVDYGALILRGDTAGDLAVIPGSPADKAGIVENDIILEVNGVKIDEKNPLANVVSKYSVGDELTFKILSKGAEKMVKITLEERES